MLLPLAVFFGLLAVLGLSFVMIVRSPLWRRDFEYVAALVVVALVVLACLWAFGFIEPGAAHTVRTR